MNEPPAISSSSTLSSSDVVQLSMLITRLRCQSEPFSVYLYSQLSTSTRDAIAMYEEAKENNKLLRELLAADLNRVIAGPALSEVSQCFGIKFRPRTEFINDSDAPGAKLAHLNRLLLEDGYPGVFREASVFVSTPNTDLAFSSGATGEKTLSDVTGQSAEGCNCDPVIETVQGSAFRSGSYRLCAEVFQTSGPRKCSDDELGEDCCATFLSRDYAVFFLADGTGETPQLQLPNTSLVFCSRFLAQTLSLHTRNYFLSSTYSLLRATEFETYLRNAWSDTAKEWNELLDIQLPSLNNEQHLSILSADWKRLIDSKVDFVDISTTFMCGGLHADGHACVVSAGDSVCVVKGTSGYRMWHPRQHARLFMRLHLQPGRYRFEADQQFSVEAADWLDVEQVIAGSDGIGKIPNLIEAQGTIPFPKLLSRILRLRTQKCDDKTMCILTRRFNIETCITNIS